MGWVFATHSLYTLSYKFFQRKMFNKPLLSFKTAYMSNIKGNILIQKFPVIYPLPLLLLNVCSRFCIVEEEEEEYVHICLDWDSIMLCFTANRLFIPNGLICRRCCCFPLLLLLLPKAIFYNTILYHSTQLVPTPPPNYYGAPLKKSKSFTRGQTRFGLTVRFMGWNSYFCFFRGHHQQYNTICIININGLVAQLTTRMSSWVYQQQRLL